MFVIDEIGPGNLSCTVYLSSIELKEEMARCGQAGGRHAGRDRRPGRLPLSAFMRYLTAAALQGRFVGSDRRKNFYSAELALDGEEC